MSLGIFECNGQRMPVTLAVNDDFITQQDENPTVDLFRAYQVQFDTEDDAIAAVRTVYVPMMLRRLESLGLPTSVACPYISSDTDLPALLSGFALQSPYRLNGTAGQQYDVTNKATGAVYGQIRTNLLGSDEAITSASFSFPVVYGSFNSIHAESISYSAINTDRTKYAQIAVSASYAYSDYQNKWLATAVAECPYGVRAVPDGALDGVDIIENDDPISQGGEADNEPAIGSPFTGAGGMGTFSRTSDSIGVPSDPAISAVDTGLVTLYCGSASSMQSLANFLWSGAFDVDTFKKLFTSPMDCIIGSSMLPVTPPTYDAATIIFGSVDTEVGMPRATNQYANVDCGTITINEYWGAYLDYSPYSKLQIFLPYIGFKELNVDEIMGKTLGVKYKIDCLSGACTAFITVNGSVYYTYSGSCAIQVPLTANNWGQAISSIIQVAGQAIGGAVAGGPAGALVSGGAALAQNAVAGGFKPEIQRKGSVTGAGGWLAVQRPYVILEWPRQSKPQNLPKFEGYPANETMVLGQCSGYTKVEEINLDKLPATAAELAEIESLLKGGVLL